VVEAGANVQDTCVMHGFPGTDTVVGENVSVGHGAVLHGCRIGRNVLIGMNAVVMDNATIGESAIIAACAFVKAGMEVPGGVLVAGMPAKVRRELSEQEMQWKIEGTQTYQQLAVRSANTMREVAPLSQIEEDRKRLEFPEHVKPLVETKKYSP
jgi:phenylacetic acid degradation protein